MKKRNLKNIVILGGGTAGWITALYVKRVLPDSSITLIESDEIGILGAGEGSTPHLVNFLDFVGIPASKLIKEADATIKNGIKFTNWKNDNSFYYHGFHIFNNLGFDGCNIHERALSINSGFTSSIAIDGNVEEFSVISKISEENKVPFIYKSQMESNPVDNILKYDSMSMFSLHFNAVMLADSLRTIAISRGVTRIEGIVDSIKEDKNKDISEVSVGNKNFPVDFIFDCSGFSKVIIGKHYKSKWKSHSDKLPVDSALPFFIPINSEDPIPAYTESIAMKYGWMWKIPTKERFGCGYVYDSSLISEEEARKEIEDYLGYEPIYPRKEKGSFRFSAGYYETPWVNNCIAVGLSSGFIEPLEATSIWVTLQTLQNALSNVEVMASLDPRNARDFNKNFCSMSDAVVNFVYLHYMSGRTDTEFWKKFTVENSPEYIKNMMNTWEYRLPQFEDFNRDPVWSMNSWVAVASGIDRLNLDLFKKAFEISFAQREASSFYKEAKERHIMVKDLCVDHRIFLKDLSK
jgi:tryptophan halogenase